MSCLLCWLLLSPALLALPAPSRPACCLAGGAHHCDDLDMGAASDGSDIFRATNPCPYQRVLATVAQHRATLPVAAAAWRAQRSDPLQTSALYRIHHALTASESDRAPPARC